MLIFRPRTGFARVLVVLAPLIAAILIAISRLQDYRHDVYDVTTGSILGLVVAYFSYSRYYPSLKSPCCNIPYPSRAEWASKMNRGRPKDEEARVDNSGNYSVDELESEADQVPLRNTSGEAGRFLGSSRDS